MTTTLTDVEKINRLPWLTAADILNTAFFLLTFSGPIFLLFLDELGLDNAQIGILLSLIPFCGIVAPFIAPMVQRIGYKKVFVIFWTARKIFIALLLLTPFIVMQYGSEWAFIWIASVIFSFALCRAIAETGGYPWKKEAVPDTIRGKFTAINNMLATIAGILVTAGASYVIGSGSGLSRFMLLIAVGVGIGFISVWCYARVPDSGQTPEEAQDHGHLQGMWQAIRDREFLFFLGTLGLATIGGTSVIAFIPLFMKIQVGLSDSNVVLLSIGTYAGALLSSFLWGWTADRYGSKPVMQSSLYLMMVLPIAWFLIPRQNDASAIIAMMIAFIAGVATLAWQISWMRYLFVVAIPAQQKSPYMAVYYAWYGLVSGAGPLLAGQILNRSNALQGQFGPVVLDSYAPLFATSFLLLIIAVITVSQLRSAEATPFRRFAGMFVRGNAIRALQSLIQYNLSGNEMTRMLTTERMGDAQSALSNNELIEALHDPSFNVRYEAIHSIGRIPPTPELVAALIEMLDEGHSELSFVITRSLGRLGDPRAIEPLRKLLFSGYHLLEANSARALAMIGDTASIPHLLTKFREEQNKTLRIAYASALGTLRVFEAIDELFVLLRETQAEIQRAELGLALARMAGDERYYMQQWRALQAESHTAIAQALLGLQKMAHQAGLDKLEASIEACAQSFAQGDSTKGVSCLEQIIYHLPPSGLEEGVAHILAECAESLNQFGDSRLEFILLTLHTLDIALSQLVKGVTLTEAKGSPHEIE